MKKSVSMDSRPIEVFEQFPKFSNLKLADRIRYEAVVKDFPPYADLGFPALMFWWNTLDGCAVSNLNGNLVISYWLPGLESFSGLSMVGEHDIEASMCEIFDWQRSRGEQPHLVHVPEFMLSRIEHPDMFICKAEREFDEYIYDIADFYPMPNLKPFRRKRVENFIKRTDSTSVEFKPLELDDPATRAMLLDRVEDWRKTGYLNDGVAIEVDAIKLGFYHNQELGIRCLGLFVNGQLHGFFIYYFSHDRQYAIITNARMNIELPWTLDYALYAFGRTMDQAGVRWINSECDMGSAFMRTFKLSLGPTEFLRKYTIEPA